MHPDEVVIDVHLVRRLLVTQFPEWSHLSIEPVAPRGTDNALYRLGDEMVVRMPRMARPMKALVKEREWLPRLAPRLSLAVPVALATGVPGAGYPFEWCVYRWLPGVDATVEPVVDDERLAGDLVQFLTTLQAIDPTGGPRPGEHNVLRGEPVRRRNARTRAAIEALGDSIDARAVLAVWESALRAPDWQEQPVWIHGDLDARNVLVEDGRLSAVVDWGCLGVGDPACDVMVVWKLLSKETREIFRAALSIDDATWARSRGWALSQALGALSYYTLETNRALVEEGHKWLVQVLADDT